MIDATDKPSSPVVPVQLGLDDRFQFRCHRGIACFNKCCENIDILLTPYDIVQLRRRFGMTAREFIDAYTVDVALDAHGMPGLKLKTAEGSTACVNLTTAGCGIYDDRPAACRYYALGLVSLRRKDFPRDEDSYFVVKEPHCLGHAEPHVQTVRQFRREQGLEEHDEITREWRRIILKKRSSGPTVGRPSQRSFELFYLASYDIDGFREFVASAGCNELFSLGPEFNSKVLPNDVELLKFGFRLLKQVLFGEVTIPLNDGARKSRLARRGQRAAREGFDESRWLADNQDELYESPGE